MKDIIIIFIGAFLGYLVGSHHRDALEGQRDRLSDYIREYHDLQGVYHNREDSICDILFAIEKWQKEDNRSNDLPFSMNLEKWSYAY